MWSIGNTLLNAALEAAGGMAVSSAVSFLIERRKTGSKRHLEAEVKTTASTLDMQDGLDVTLYSLQHELMKIRSAISAARGRRIADQELLEWLAQIINASYLGNYYYRTFKQRNSHPLMIESEDTNNLAISTSYRKTKQQRTSRTFLFGDEKNMKLHDILKMLKNIDIPAFLLMVNVQPVRPMKTYMYMENNRLLNRDKERQQVMNFLFEPSKDGENNVTVLPLVGPPRGGKTSVALHCFYDPKEYTVGNAQTEPMWGEIFARGRFHLDCRLSGLENPLGLPELRKTRKQVMIDGFSEEEYLLFFNEHAFGAADPEDYPELAKMGREIAKKINRSVWGAKILGELLRDNLNAPFWSNFLHGGFLSPLERGNDFWLVVKTMCLLLPKNLQLYGIASQVEEGHEDKTFREIMALGRNHCTPLIKEEGNYGVKFTVSVPIFLNKCMNYRVVCVPTGDQSNIVFL
ncbi:hypothetical protein LUZ61_017075 [Rhynchospora tenuis]|uniref:Rx N-terminal domain-containing protein n=1 Tax=Rhynchospora tenuis TaxID=198213 RepID=A0AAD5Z6S0_9POAL|nr:hypothetical protein LUZ61_017075 [Rhynchospora tenuis]